MAIETVNLRAAEGNPPASARLLGTAELPVPDQRFPDDESWIAPLLSVDFGEGGRKYFRYVSGSFMFGGVATPEYQEVVPVALALKDSP